MPRTTHRDRFSDKEPSPRGLASYEVNAGAAVSFSPGANYFRGRRREPEPGTTSGARRCFACEGRPLAPYGTLATSENKRGDPPVRQQAGRGYCPRPTWPSKLAAAITTPIANAAMHERSKISLRSLPITAPAVH